MDTENTEVSESVRSANMKLAIIIGSISLIGFAWPLAIMLNL